jgi:hypothetical protein
MHPQRLLPAKKFRNLDGLYRSGNCQLGNRYLEKLRNAKGCYYPLSQRGRENFVITNLVAEVANSYYELLAQDNQLKIVQQNIGLQKCIGDCKS